VVVKWINCTTVAGASQFHRVGHVIVGQNDGRRGQLGAPIGEDRLRTGVNPGEAPSKLVI